MAAIVDEQGALHIPPDRPGPERRSDRRIRVELIGDDIRVGETIYVKTKPKCDQAWTSRNDCDVAMYGCNHECKDDTSCKSNCTRSHESCVDRIK
jgi:hypothetical protein